MIDLNRFSIARCAVLLSLALSLPACGGDRDDEAGTDATGDASPATASQSVDDQLAELSEYRLSMDKIDRYIEVQRNLAKRAAALSPAERKAIGEKYAGRDNSNANLDDMARNIAEVPEWNAAVREAGLSPREFATISMSMIQSAMAASVLKMRPNDDADSLAREMKVNPDNIKFYQQNEAEIARKTNELSAEMKRLGVSEGG